LFSVRLREIKVQRLAHIQPLLSAARALNQPARFNLEGSAIELFEVGRDPFDRRHAAVEVLEIVDHRLVPQAAALEIAGSLRHQFKTLKRTAPKIILLGNRIEYCAFGGGELLF